MNYPTNLLRAFAVVCSWRILRAKITHFSDFAKSEKWNLDITYYGCYEI